MPASSATSRLTGGVWITGWKARIRDPSMSIRRRCVRDQLGSEARWHERAFPLVLRSKQYVVYVGRAEPVLTVPMSP